MFDPIKNFLVNVFLLRYHLELNLSVYLKCFNFSAQFQPNVFKSIFLSKICIDHTQKKVCIYLSCNLLSQIPCNVHVFPVFRQYRNV